MAGESTFEIGLRQVYEAVQEVGRKVDQFGSDHRLLEHRVTQLEQERKELSAQRKADELLNRQVRAQLRTALITAGIALLGIIVTIIVEVVK